MKYYIAYGSNLNTRQMTTRCPDSNIYEKATLKDYRLEFRGAKENSYFTIARAKGNNIPVLIWELEKSDEQYLDRYEGYPNFYRKENMEVELYNGEKLRRWFI